MNYFYFLFFSHYKFDLETSRIVDNVSLFIKFLSRRPVWLQVKTLLLPWTEFCSIRFSLKASITQRGTRGKGIAATVPQLSRRRLQAVSLLNWLNKPADVIGAHR